MSDIENALAEQVTYDYEEKQRLNQRIAELEIGGDMSDMDLALHIASAIFATGDAGAEKVQRIQFMGGTPEAETALGGLGKSALRSVIYRAICQKQDGS